MAKDNTKNKTIGSQNYVMDNCPFYLPKENAAFFKQMQKAADSGRICTYDRDWNANRTTFKPGSHEYRDFGKK